MPKVRLKTVLVSVSSCAIAWLADAATKEWALAHNQAAIVTLIPNVLHALVPPLKNYSAGSLIPGLGMGPFADLAVYGTIVIPILLSLCALYWMYRVDEVGCPPLTLTEQLGFGMLLGGTFSNLYDRLVRHAVIDFLNLSIFDFWLWNVADVFVPLGLFLVGLEALRLKRLTRLSWLISNHSVSESLSKQ
jgi:lipoprotein signal peptidase